MNKLGAIWYPSLLTSIAVTLAALALPHWIAGVFAIVAVLLAMDTRARLPDYRRLVISINRWGFIPTVYEPYLRTKCSREVLRAAARETRRSASYPVILRKHGYRWWHLAPDGAFTRNSPFLNPKFWRAALGV